MTEDEITTAIVDFPPEFREYIIVKNTIYCIELYPDDRGLREAQGDKEFYIPTLEEIRELGTTGCLVNCREAKYLRRFLTKNTDADQDEADLVCRMIQREITADCTMQDVFQIFEVMELEVRDDRRLDELVTLINDLWNNTRMLLNRGFTPNELSAQAMGNRLPLPAKNNIIAFRPGGKTKIYPNDPCPCGSGKKYKSCCKNKR